MTAASGTPAASEPVYDRGGVRVFHGDCLDVLATLVDNSIDSIVTDPPYDLTAGKSGRGFMGESWDGTGIAFRVELWRECLRVLKPGGHLASFGGTRTYHRMACAVEDAGFEIRDSLIWGYSTGFPKSLDVSKAIDKTAGIRRGRAGDVASGNGLMSGENYDRTDKGTPAPDAARTWEGWGTALKPSFEPLVLARKPLSEPTVVANVLAHGTGAINVDACRVAISDTDRVKYAAGTAAWPRRDERAGTGNKIADIYGVHGARQPSDAPAAGRWPSNTILSHAPGCDDDTCAPGCPVAGLDAQSGTLRARGNVNPTGGGGGMYGHGETTVDHGAGDEGAASRFVPVFRYDESEIPFRYASKAPTSERPQVGGVAHPTVKPVSLMAWVVRLLTPPGGVVLDMFAGSGTTGRAAQLQGFSAVLIERDARYLPVIEARLESRRREDLEMARPRRDAAAGGGDLFDFADDTLPA